MKAVAADALSMKMLRNSVVIGDGGMLPVKGSIEACNLRQSRPVDHDRPYGLQIMRLMQRRERDVPLEAVQHLLRYKNRLIEFRAAMHHAMADGDWVDVKLVAQPRAGSMQRCRNVRHGFGRVGSLDQNL